MASEGSSGKGVISPIGYEYKLLEGTDKMFTGEILHEEDGKIQIAGFFFDLPKEKKKLLDLQNLDFHHGALLVPRIVEEKTAFYQNFGVWDVGKVGAPVKGYCIPRKDTVWKILLLPSAYGLDICAVFIDFFNLIHGKGYVADEFRDDDFVLLDGKPRLYKTQIFLSSDLQLKEKNRKCLKEFVMENLFGQYKHSMAPCFLHFMDLLEAGHPKLSRHIQLLGPELAILKFKSALDLARGLDQYKQLKSDWTKVLSRLETPYRTTVQADGRPFWQSEIMNDPDSHCYQVLCYQRYGKSVKEFFRCLRNLLTHLTDIIKFKPELMFCIIEEKFPNLLNRFQEEVNDVSPALAVHFGLDI